MERILIGPMQTVFGKTHKHNAINRNIDVHFRMVMVVLHVLFSTFDDDACELHNLDFPRLILGNDSNCCYLWNESPFGKQMKFIKIL